MTSIRDIVLAQQGSDARFERTKKITQGRIVAINGSVDVSGRPGFVWVQERGQAGCVPIFNPTVLATDNLPVIIGPLPKPPFMRIILSVDWSHFMYSPDYDGESYIKAHHNSHQWPDFAPGTDVVTVYPRALSMLRTYAGSSGLTVSVSPLRYYYSGTIQTFDGIEDYDISANQPAVGLARFVLTYLNMSTNVIGVINGDTTVDAGAEVPDMPAVPANCIPSAVVRLDGSQTAVAETDITDARMILDPVGNYGWPFDTNVTTVDPSDPDADYNSLEAALDAVVSGTILVGSGTYTVDNKHLAYGVNLVGLDRDGVIIQTMSESICLTLMGNNYVQEITVRCVLPSGVSAIAIRTDPSSSAGVYLHNVSAYAYADPSIGSAVGIGIYTSAAMYADAEYTLVDVDSEAVAHDAYALEVSGSGVSPVVHVVDGSYNGGSYDVYTYVGGGIIYLHSARVANGTFGEAGAVIRGQWYDVSVPSFMSGDFENHTEIETDGTVEFIGNATTWEPVYVSALTMRAGASAPGLAEIKNDGIGSTGVFTYVFDPDVDEQLVFSIQLPHGYKEGTDIVPYARWCPVDGNAGDVVWGLEYTYANVDEAFGTTMLAFAVDAASGTEDDHLYVQFPTINMSGGLYGWLYGEIGGVFLCRVFREADRADDTYGSDAALLGIGFHCERDTVGSRTMTTK